MSPPFLHGIVSPNKPFKHGQEELEKGSSQKKGTIRGIIAPAPQAIARVMNLVHGNLCFLFNARLMIEPN